MVKLTHEEKPQIQSVQESKTPDGEEIRAQEKARGQKGAREKLGEEARREEEGLPEEARLTVRTCERCRFYLPDETRKDGMGYCRRYPPEVYWDEGQGYANEAFPNVNSGSWCGEYRPLLEVRKGRS